MDATGAGTAIMVAIAAVLWFAYFVPTWVARREYLDTERTATRLQQTLRIMAETAEVPDQVRVEVSAREAARQERLLRAQQRDRDRAAERDARAIARHAGDRAAAAPRAAAPSAASATAAARRSTAADLDRLRRRRAHRLATVLMIVSTVTIGVQLWLVASSGAVVGSWVVLAGGAAIGLVAVGMRRRLDARRVRSAQTAIPREARPVAAEPVARPARGRASTWTPVPVPPPLYLSRPETQTITPAPDVAAQLRRAALAAEESLRAAHAEPEVVPFRAPASAPAAASRWAGMGRLDAVVAAADAAPDLDEVLRRRRNAG
jgi:hypothetical protein